MIHQELFHNRIAESYLNRILRKVKIHTSSRNNAFSDWSKHPAHCGIMGGKKLNIFSCRYGFWIVCMCLVVLFVEPSDWLYWLQTGHSNKWIFAILILSFRQWLSFSVIPTNEGFLIENVKITITNYWKFAHFD